MRLATAFVEITAQTEDFRRQLREARELADDAGRSIGRSLQLPWSRWTDELAEGTSRAPRGAAPPNSLFDGPAPPRIDPGPARLPEPGRESAAGGAGPWPRSFATAARPTDERALWGQQLELERKELDVLQKQLDVLKELRQGIPAVLT